MCFAVVIVFIFEDVFEGYFDGFGVRFLRKFDVDGGGVGFVVGTC